MMNLDPTLFESSMHETANEAVVFCKEYLEKAGHEEAAKQLAGYLPLHDGASAYLLVRVLEHILPAVSGEAAKYVSIALSTARRAVRREDVQLSAVA